MELSGKLVYSTTTRETGTVTELYDTDHKDLRWLVVCSAHGNGTPFKKQGDAYKAMVHPKQWCDDCSGGRVKAKVVEASPNAVPASPPPPNIDYSKMTRTQLRQANACGMCYGRLQAADGHYHQKGPYPYPDCCCKCFGDCKVKAERR